jgi:hypothetical protein
VFSNSLVDGDYVSNNRLPTHVAAEAVMSLLPLSLSIEANTPSQHMAVYHEPLPAAVGADRIFIESFTFTNGILLFGK